MTIEPFEIKAYWLRELAQIASREETRYVLNGVHLELRDDGIVFVATNGRQLAAYYSPNPQFAGNAFSFTIPNALIDQIPWTRLETISVSYKDDRITIASPNHVALSVAPMEAKFPLWRQVIPNPWPENFNLNRLNIRFNYLYDLCRCGQRLTDTEDFSFAALDEISPLLIRGGQYGQFLGVLMPVRFGLEELKTRPAWA